MNFLKKEDFNFNFSYFDDPQEQNTDKNSSTNDLDNSFNRHNFQPEAFENVLKNVKDNYFKYIYQIEKNFHFSHFYSPLLCNGDFDSRPMILLLGQYSTGKTSFVKHLIEKEYIGMIVGPEPTSDRFTAIEYGAIDQLIYGNAAVSDNNSPYYPLSEFGNDFLSRFVISQVNSLTLKSITVIDTPGILSGNKQTTRGYEFEKIVKWFAERSDLILLFFDAYKLDISDEFQRCISELKGHEIKIRILLNKADSIERHQLLRVYGALMWYLGKVIDSPEVVRVYIGSFWDAPLHFTENRDLFEHEENELMSEISNLHRTSSLRKLSDFARRLRLVQSHAMLLNYLKKQIPYFGKETKKLQILQNLDEIIKLISNKNAISLGDFPPSSYLKTKLTNFDWSLIPKLEQKYINSLNQMLKVLMPKYINSLINLAQTHSNHGHDIQAGTLLDTDSSPFHISRCTNKQNIDEIIKIDTNKYKNDFNSLKLDGEKISGVTVKDHFMSNNLPSSILHKIWNLADTDHDGYLTFFEYCIARYLIEMKLLGNELPTHIANIQFIE